MNLLLKDRAEKILKWLRRGGVSYRQIARELGVNRKTVLRYAKRAALHPEHLRRRNVIWCHPRITVSLDVIERFEDTAELRGITRDVLMSEILTVIADDDLFNAVLG